MSGVIPKLEMFRSELDSKLIASLSPLQKYNAELYIPFFANTFPLAFHYACKVQQTEKELDDIIKFVSWAQETPSNHHNVPIVYYTTQQDSPPAEGAANVCVTEFQPCWLFSEFNLKVWQERNRIAKDTGKNNGIPEIEFNQIVPHLKDIRFFEVFTEIPVQAQALLHALLEESVRSIGAKINFFQPLTARSLLPIEDHLRNNTLRLFLYGAPLTSYFLRKKQRYIPFRVGNLKEASTSFRTVIVVRNGNKDQREEILQSLEIYHRDLYSGAKAEVANPQQSFRAVQYSYNRMARILQHRSSFLSSKDYAECLDAHHKAPT